MINYKSKTEQRQSIRYEYYKIKEKRKGRLKKEIKKKGIKFWLLKRGKICGNILMLVQTKLTASRIRPFLEEEHSINSYKCMSHARGLSCSPTFTKA